MRRFTVFFSIAFKLFVFPVDPHLLPGNVPTSWSIRTFSLIPCPVGLFSRRIDRWIDGLMLADAKQGAATWDPIYTITGQISSRPHTSFHLKWWWKVGEIPENFRDFPRWRWNIFPFGRPGPLMDWWLSRSVLVSHIFSFHLPPLEMIQFWRCAYFWKMGGSKLNHHLAMAWDYVIYESMFIWNAFLDGKK